MIKHGLCINKKHSLYKRYYSMRDRCYNPNSLAFKNYGGRGIKVCEEWLEDIMNFYNWAINNGYKENLTLDRIDVNGNYEPNNCRWISDYQQRFNKRNNKLLTINNETKTITEWAQITGLNVHTIYSRIRYNWSNEDLLKEKICNYDYLKNRNRDSLGKFCKTNKNFK